MKAKLLKKFRSRFYYFFKGNTITFLNKKEVKEYIIEVNNGLELKELIAVLMWGTSGILEAHKNQQKKEKNIIKRKYKHLKL